MKNEITATAIEVYFSRFGLTQSEIEKVDALLESNDDLLMETVSAHSANQVDESLFRDEDTKVIYSAALYAFLRNQTMLHLDAGRFDRAASKVESVELASARFESLAKSRNPMGHYSR